MISGICFDLGGTLLKSVDGQSGGMCQRIAAVVGKPLEELLPSIDSHLRCRVGSMDTLAREFCLAVNYHDANRLIREAINQKSSVSIYDDVHDTLRELRRYKLGVISNGACWNTISLEDLGITAPFSTIVYSFIAGYTKPDARIFRIAEREMGIPARELVFVGDSPSDVLGANRAGWRSVFIRRSERYGVDRDADHVIRDLRSLPELVKKL